MNRGLKYIIKLQQYLLLIAVILFSQCLFAQDTSTPGLKNSPQDSFPSISTAGIGILINGPFCNGSKDTLAANMLPANCSSVSFWITAYPGSDSIKTAVEYRLNSSGHSSSWVSLSKTGEIIFHQLKAGKYILEARKKTTDNRGSDYLVSKSFEVDTVWYKKTRWILLLLLLSAAALYAFFTLYHARLMKKKKELEAKVLDRTTELLKTNNDLKEKIAELDLIRSNLTKTNKLSEQLISILSHDVHSPLRFSTMVGKAVLTKQQDLSKEEIIDALNDINQTGVRVLLLISNLLKWMEYQKEHFAPQLLKENLRQMVQDKIEFFRFMADGKNIELINNIPEGLIITTEKTAFGIIIQNLLNNAVKFTPDGEIEVSAIANEKNITINIIDTGMGIPAKSIEAILNNEMVTPLSDTENMKGNGIGWSVIKQLLYHLNGSFEIKSGNGLGTTVTLVFPVN